MIVTADVSDIARLAALLNAAAVKPAAGGARAVSEVANRTADNARSGAPVATGELRSSIYVQGAGLSQVIGSDVRQAFFLEAGSPNTGAPRPWLTDPAEAGAADLLEKLGEIGAIW